MDDHEPEQPIRRLPDDHPAQIHPGAAEHNEARPMRSRNDVKRPAAQIPAKNPASMRPTDGFQKSLNQSTAGSFRITETPGKTCVSSAHTSRAVEATRSKIVSTARADARVGYVAPSDPALEEVEAEDVAAASRKKRVDAGTRKVGAEEIAPRDGGVGVRGGEDVALSACARSRFQPKCRRSSRSCRCFPRRRRTG